MMRKYVSTGVISLLIFIIPFLLIPEGVSGTEVSHLHWNPTEIREGDIVTIFVLVSNITTDDPVSVHLIVEDENLTMVPWDDDDHSNRSTIYSVDHEFKDFGNHNLTLILISISGSSSAILGQIFVEEGGRGDDDTILGLPRWWCSVSIIIATGGFIFITWAYFKGRKLQIQKQAETGIKGSVCSECGKGVPDDVESCPHCGADLSDIEYICGKCGKELSSSVSRCPHCRTNLHEMNTSSGGGSRKSSGRKRSDPDLNKLKSPVKMAGKVECYECGCIYLSKEKSCPECGSSRKGKGK